MELSYLPTLNVALWPWHTQTHVAVAHTATVADVRQTLTTNITERSELPSEDQTTQDWHIRRQATAV